MHKLRSLMEHFCSATKQHGFHFWGGEMYEQTG
ncbi:hypothetical protein ABIC22_004942 [Paenibacillus sp. PvP094]